jgi:hypothetical protein
MQKFILGAFRVTVVVAISMLCMVPSIAVNVLHQITHASSAAPVMGWAFAGGAVLSVLGAGCMPIAVRRFMDRRQWFPLAAAAMLFVICAGYNLQCAIGAASSARSESVVTRSSAKNHVQTVSNQLEEAIVRRATLSVTAKGKTPALADVAIRRAQLDPAWSRSKKCTDATQPESLKLCTDIAQMVAEKDAATKIEDLDREIHGLRSQAGALPKDGDEGAVDPQAENIVAVLTLFGIATNTHGVGLAINTWGAVTWEALAFLMPLVVEALAFGQASPSPAHPKQEAAAPPVPLNRGGAIDVDPESGEPISDGRDQPPALTQSVGMVEEAVDASVEAKSEPSPVAQLPAPEAGESVPANNVEPHMQCEVAIVPTQTAGVAPGRKRTKAAQKDSGNVTMLHPVDIGPGSDVRAFVRETVTGKTMLRSDVHKAAGGRFNEKAIDRAAKALGVIVTKPDPTKKPVAWSLPAIALKRIPSIRG